MQLNDELKFQIMQKVSEGSNQLPRTAREIAISLESNEHFTRQLLKKIAEEGNLQIIRKGCIYFPILTDKGRETLAELKKRKKEVVMITQQ